jgi:glycosyltransferase involved in cell wall biosynthesis
MKKLLFFVTEDWYFVSHRLALAKSARNLGYSVYVVTRCQQHAQLLADMGFIVIPYNAKRSSLNPFTLLLESIVLAKIYREVSPSIVHHVALRPVIVGAISAQLAGIKRVVSSITGMGFLFTEEKRSKNVQRALQWLFPKLLKKSTIIVQNPDDYAVLTETGLAAANIRLIPGVGVDITKYLPRRYQIEENPIVIMMASRLLWDKGVKEFIQAARSLYSSKVRFVLVGKPDQSNPASVHGEDLSSWVTEGIVEYWGHRDDMHNVLPKAHIVCLPSYREGFPKVLLEAMACEIPCITTDVPGCRDAVRDGDNGLLVPARNATALTSAIRKLVEDPKMRTRMGARGRERVVNEFTQERMVDATLAIYQDLLIT